MRSRLQQLATNYLFGRRGMAKSVFRKRLTVFALLTMPILLIAAVSFIELYQELTAGVWARRQAIASLSASIIKEKFDRLMDVGVSLATRVRFRDLIANDKWDEAIQVLAEIPKELPYIERLFLADTAGTLRADTPAISGMAGQNFAHRDWYKGVSAEWKPYLSEVYVRQAAPRRTVLAVAAPIRKADDTPVGILVIQVRTETLFQWTDQVDVGAGGFVYVVDRRGRIAAHPKYRDSVDLIDFSTVPAVAQVISGKVDTELTYNPIEQEERLTAYMPVDKYGWGIIAQQPARLAYRSRDSTLFFMAAIYGLIVVFTCMLAYLILSALEESHHLQTQLREHVIVLEATNKELEAFSYSVSHDLRAPLRSLEGFSRILQEDYYNKIDAAGQDSLNRIRAGALRMSTLIDDLLNLARVSRHEVQKQDVDLSAMARSIVGELQRGDSQRQVQVEIVDGARVHGDPRLLRIMLENLLNNAWKFTGKSAQPRIQFGKTQDFGSGTAFFVRDNGAGFDMSYYNKLFGPFQRLHAMTEFNGTGVGLATVQRIVLKHGGKVWADAKVGEGATFYFVI